MKRFSVLMLVLGLSSISNAATVAVYTNTTQGVAADAPTTINAVGDQISIVVSENVGIAGGVAGFTVDVEHSTGMTCSLTGPVPFPWMFPPLVTILPFGANGETTNLGVGTAQFPPAPRDYFTVTFTVPNSVLTDANFSIDISYTGLLVGGKPADAALPTVPEPMTIALLGLGGLFLRRRK